MFLINETVLLARDVITRPAEAFKRIAAPPHALLPAAIIYILFSTAHAVFYALKPPDFPAEAAQLMTGLGQTAALPLLTWLWTELSWGTVFLAAWIFFLAFFIQLLRSGRLPLKIIAALSAAVLPGAGMVLLARRAVSPAVMALCWTLILAVPGFFSFRMRGCLKPLLSLFFALNAISLLIIPAQAAAAAVRWENAYISAQFIGAAWMLAVSASGIRTITATGITRNVLALFFSLIFEMTLIYSLNLAGIIPASVLKVLLVP